MKIILKKDFSRTPGARNEQESLGFSGEKFREELLFPKLKEAIEKNQKLIVNLDGTSGCGPSFLEESFGGLIRINKMDYKEVKAKLEIISNEMPSYKKQIEKYLKNAGEVEGLV